MDPVKSSHGTPQGWLTAEQPAPSDPRDPSEGDELAEEWCEPTIVRLDSSAFEALFLKARS